MQKHTGNTSPENAPKQRLLLNNVLPKELKQCLGAHKKADPQERKERCLKTSQREEFCPVPFGNTHKHLVIVALSFQILVYMIMNGYHIHQAS